MELLSKFLEQIAYYTKSKIEEHMLIVMDKSTHEEHLSQPLQTNIKQFKIAVTFLTRYNGIFKVLNSNNKFYFAKSISDEDGFFQITIPESAYEIESVNIENERIIIEEGHYTELIYPFTIKPKFSTLGSIVEIFTQGPVTIFAPDNSMGGLLGVNKTSKYEKYNLSPNTVDISSLDNFFPECDIAQGMIFTGKISGILLWLSILVINRLKKVEVDCNGI